MSTSNFRNMTRPDWYNLMYDNSASDSQGAGMQNPQISSISNFIWNIADSVLRDHHMRGKYRDVILPMTVIRRLDAVLAPTKEVVLAEQVPRPVRDLDGRVRLDAVPPALSTPDRSSGTLASG